MKKLNLLIALFLLLHAGMKAQSALIEFKFTSSKGYTGTSQIKYSDYGSRVDFNMSVPQMPGGGIVVSTLIKKDTPDMVYTINDKNKTYSETKKSSAQQEDTKTYSVKKLGDETVSGYKCTRALVTEGNETSEVWNTKDIAEYNKYAEAMNSNKKIGSYKRQQALKDAGCDGFTVKMIKKGDPRQGDLTMEMVKFEKKSFPKSDFEIPAGYTKSEGAAAPAGGPQIKSQQELMNMTPEERAKYAEELKKQYGKGN